MVLAATRGRFAPQRVASWFVLGLGAALAELGLLRLLYEGLGLPLTLASALAAETLILVKFAIADRWVFGHARPRVDRLLRYHGACAGALVVYWVVLNGLASLLGVPYVVAFLLGSAASFAWSLLTNFLWVWTHSTARGVAADMPPSGGTAPTR